MAAQRKNSGAKVAITTALTIVIAVALLLTQGNKLADLLSEDRDVSFHYTDNTVAVNFIDVGPGASTLIQSGEDGILIDAGEREYADTVINYIKDSGVKKLVYVVASHPHSDHIGALSDVLNAVKTENVIMPRLTEENTPTTKSYEYLLKTIRKKKIKTIEARMGDVFKINNAQIEVLGPLVQDSHLNNMSVVCRLTAFSTRFMLLADAEKAELRSILDQTTDLKSNILSMGHHGSSNSIYTPYLNQVNADVAVISCGSQNDYGYPHRETLKYIQKHGMECYRTDLHSHIVFVCNERGYQIHTAA